MAKKKILATSWHSGGINAIIPVIKRLKQEKLIDTTVIGHEYSEKILQNADINYKTIKDYALQDVSKSSMESLLQKEPSDLIFTGTSMQDKNNKDVVEQTIISAAQGKIPSLAVLDFWGNYYQRFSDVYTGEKFKFLPDKIAIMDDYAEKAMLEEGFDKNRLIITGNPHFDSLKNKAENFTKQEKQITREKISLNLDAYIFYAANVWKKEIFGFWDLDNIKLVNKVINNLPKDKKNKVGLVVKLHPRTPKEDLEEITKYINSEKNIKLVADIHPQDLVLASDLTLTPCSTVGIEAVYMKKPCISMQPGLKREDYLAILTQNKIIPAGYTKEDCKNLIRKAIIDKNYRENELIQKASKFRTDGKATERVTELVYDMIS